MGDAHTDEKREEKKYSAYIGFLESFINYLKKPTRETQKQIQMTALEATHYISEEKYFEFEFQKGEEFFERLERKSKLLRNCDFPELQKFLIVLFPYRKLSRKINEFIEKTTPEE